MSKFSLNTLGTLLADKSGLSQVEAELFIRKMFDVCNLGLDADKQVKIKWLGTFKVQATRDRESINVNTGERFTIEGRDKLTFTPDNILKEIVNKPFAQFETVVVNDGVDFDEIDEKFGEEQTDDAPAQVIDFLDEEKTATPNPEVVVIGSEKEKKAEDELAKQQIAIEQAKLEKLKQAQLEQERIQKEKLEKEKQEQERLEQERLEQERLEQERLEQERLEQERLEQERLEQERLEQERLEQERLEQEKLELAQQQQALKAVVEPAVPASDESEEEEEEEVSSNSHHIVIPRYLVVAVCLIVVALIGGMGWFAFNYGQMTAQRDHLAMQLNQYHQAPAKKVPAKPAAAPLSQKQKLRQKAMEDSIRMAKTAEAVKLAENSDEESASAEKAKQTEVKAKAEAKEKAKDKAEEKATSKIASSQYDKDARVRTGAYRITGVAQTVTVGAGQTLEQISTRYLGSGMECYVEALNGTSIVKAGQKIKIPKLELKKKKK
ncbi:HU family DNA-binding protein [Segatella copri]|uniref:HU family DNA-binding protein n=1 Tax=Segatella copri TaxID=165179 RepID=UPI00222EBC29|nr:HU family DNA-binding protein [Segatella copri]MCW4110971.1 HU family DNA-binding protein [Segatella copri]MCW4121164.1 HU family DNA-binding protein [Segatella copri]